MVKKIFSKYKSYDKCQMCCKYKSTIWFDWEAMLTKIKQKICRDCAYKETFGTRNWMSAKKNKKLEG